MSDSRSQSTGGDPQTNRVVRSWLHEDRHEDAVRVLGAVLETVETTAQRRKEPFVNKFVAVGLAAAAVVIVALIGIQLIDGPGIGEPAPSASPEPSNSAVASQPETPMPIASDEALNGTGALAPGTYIIDSPFPVRARLALAGTSWNMWTSGLYGDAVAIYRLSPDPPLGAGLVLAIVDNVYDDGCTPIHPRDPQVGASTLELAEALSTQASTEIVAAPAEVTLDGYSGTSLHVRMNSSDCSEVQRWNSSAGTRAAIPGEHDRYWILDIDGTRVVVDLFSFDDTRPEDLAEVEAVVESLDFQPTE